MRLVENSGTNRVIDVLREAAHPDCELDIASPTTSLFANANSANYIDSIGRDTSFHADFGSGLYPSTVTIKRPLEDSQIVMLVEKVAENVAVPADEFEVHVPPDAQIKSLE